MRVIIEAEGTTVQYPRSEVTALQCVDLQIREGAAVGIVGESGSGKTTLGRVLVGALRPTSGVVRVEGQAWSKIRRKEDTRRRIQMVFQDPYSSLNPWLTPRQAVGEVLRVWDKRTRRQAEERAAEILSEVGLSADCFDRRPANLSGGQCQRVGIARALAADPLVLVADEPTSSLDVSIQAQILNLLARLRETRGLALVLISHDLSVIRHVTHEVLVMYAGRVVERGPTQRVLRSPSHPYTRILLDSIPGTDGPLREVDNDLGGSSGCAFAERCPFVRNDCLERPPALLERGEVRVACVRPFGDGSDSRNAATTSEAAFREVLAPSESKSGSKPSVDR